MANRGGAFSVLQSSSIEKSNAEHERPSKAQEPPTDFIMIDTAASDDYEEEERSDTGDLSKPSTTNERSPGQAPSNDNDGDSIKSTGTAEISQNPSNSSESQVEADAKPEPVRQKPHFLDPMRWFGILVPPSLRSAQTSFIDAVEGNVPRLANTVIEMQVAEKEISRLRRQLGR